MVVYVVVTSFLRNVAFLIYALFGEISILEIPVVGNFSLFAGLAQYRKILQANGANSRKYFLVEVIENDCIVT